MHSLRPANDHQMPLFDRYDMSVEFERHMTCIRQGLYRNWRDFCKMTDIEIVDEFWDGQTLAPLELADDCVTTRHVEDNLYEFAVPYYGDDQMWHLYPVDVVRGILGEVFRGELLLHVLANSCEQARGFFQKRLSAIQEVIAQQNQRIEVFEDAQPALILGELAKIRRWPPEPYIVLGQ